MGVSWGSHRGMAHRRRWPELPGPCAQTTVTNSDSEFRSTMEVELDLTGWEASRGSGGAVYPRNQMEVGWGNRPTFTNGATYSCEQWWWLRRGSELGSDWGGLLELKDHDSVPGWGYDSAVRSDHDGHASGRTGGRRCSIQRRFLVAGDLGTMAGSSSTPLRP